MGEKGLANGIHFIGMGMKRLRGAEYTCGRQWADLEPIDIIIVRAEAMKQVGFPVLLPPNDSVSGEVGIYYHRSSFSKISLVDFLLGTSLLFCLI